jgi:hypothetical protein
MAAQNQQTPLERTNLLKKFFDSFDYGPKTFVRFLLLKESFRMNRKIPRYGKRL